MLREKIVQLGPVLVPYEWLDRPPEVKARVQICAIDGEQIQRYEIAKLTCQFGLTMPTRSSEQEYNGLFRLEGEVTKQRARVSKQVVMTRVRTRFSQTKEHCKFLPEQSVDNISEGSSLSNEKVVDA